MQQTKIDELLSANPELAKKVQDLLQSEIKESHNLKAETTNQRYYLRESENLPKGSRCRLWTGWEHVTARIVSNGVRGAVVRYNDVLLYADHQYVSTNLTAEEAARYKEEEAE
jgi:hypothetical protein|tara:strand:- start:979 stop:1317 length:339 start_codon:yes stop_codon:yes gene_type:complete